jgi:hypothetical protein
MSSPTGLTIKSNINDMNIGDCIPFRYTGRYTSGTGLVCKISELGTCTATEIPITGSDTPDGLTYFIKVDKGLYICDRVVQNNIAWDILNAGNLIEGKRSLPIYLNSSISNITSSSSNFSAVFNSSNTTPCGTNSLPVDIIITFNDPITISTIGLQGYDTNWTYKNFKIYGSNDNIIYSLLYSGLSPKGAYVSYDEFNIPTISKKYKYYKLSFLDSWNGNMYLTSIKLFTQIGLLRSITGGNAYLGSDGKVSLTDQSLGGYPTNNEWDKYIVKSNLNGKITPGDDNIWHWKDQYSFCQGTTINNLVLVDNSISSGIHRMSRGAINKIKATGTNSTVAFGNNSIYSVYAFGFRPVLEYIESNSKQTNLWY